MTSCYPRPRMPWSGVTGAIARCKNRSTACARKSRSVPVLRWICGVKPKPKAVNKPSHHCIMHGLDKPGVFTTVSEGNKFTLGSIPPINPLTLGDHVQHLMQLCYWYIGVFGYVYRE